MNYKICFILLLVLLFAGKTDSQTISRQEINGGYEFMFSLPLPGRETNEAIRGDYPIAIWISSAFDTQARIEDAETGTVRNTIVRKNQITQVEYGDHVTLKESEIVKNYAIKVTAEEPISVSVLMSYKWTGEVFRVLPVSMLGREYVTVNMYQDQLLQSGEYRSPQILITAPYNETRIVYHPTAETAKGIKPGKSGSVTLNRGQSYAIFGAVIENKSQDPSTDLTGTYIQANKPIFVISGHTKVAVPRYQFTFLGRNGGFMRNMMIDYLLPFEHLGTEYISVPFQYADRPRGKIQDDRGDLIRFVATAPNTIISRKDANSNPVQISPVLNRGQYFDILNQEEPMHYISNNKVLATQFGKTWWIGAVTPIQSKDNDEPNNPSRNGAGTLTTLIPNHLFTQNQVFRSPQQIDNFVSIIFKTDYADYIYFDNKNLKMEYNDKIKSIPGSEYSYLTTQIVAGDHYIYGDTIPGSNGEKAVFTFYAYGNWDRSKDGFAFSYPAMPRSNVDCDDRFSVVEIDSGCGNRLIKAEVQSMDTSCAKLLSANIINSSNYSFKTNYISGFSRNTDLHLKPYNLQKYGNAIVRIRAISGLTWEHTYEYFPEEMKIEPDTVYFGFLRTNDTICGKTIDIVNTSSESTLEITNLSFGFHNARFEVITSSNDYPFSYPLIIPPNERRTVEICAKSSNTIINQVETKLDVNLACSQKKDLGHFKFQMGDPVFDVDDLIWTDIYVGDTSYQYATIRNIGTGILTVHSINWPDSSKNSFPQVEGLPVNLQGGNFSSTLVINPGDSIEFRVLFAPQGTGTISTTAVFSANTNTQKLFSNWTGTGYSFIDYKANDLQIEYYPNPATDYVEVSIPPLERGSGSVAQVVRVYDVLGVCVINSPPAPLHSGQGSKVRLEVSHLPPGMYFVQIGSWVSRFVKM